MGVILICPNCETEKNIVQSRTYGDGRIADNRGNQFSCDECDHKGFDFTKKETEFKGYPELGKFSAMSSQAQKDSLKQRSRDHSKRGGIDDRRTSIDETIRL